MRGLGLRMSRIIGSRHIDLSGEAEYYSPVNIYLNGSIAFKLDRNDKSITIDKKAILEAGYSIKNV